MFIDRKRECRTEWTSLSRTEYDIPGNYSQTALYETLMNACGVYFFGIGLSSERWYTFCCMKMRNSLIQTQKPVLAQVLQQSISVLMLSSAELTAAIDQELQVNPLLEGEVNTPKSISVEDLQKSLNHATDVPYQSNFINEEEDTIPIPQIESFEEHLLTQLRMEIVDSQEQKVGELIIGNLNEDGYLAISLEEIAKTLGLNDPIRIEKVLLKIQLFDPVGTASRTIEECLTVQLGVSDSPLRFKAIKIINGHLKDLCHKKYDLIAQKTQISIDDIKEAAQLIATLEPKPARNFQTFEQTFYVQPDIFVNKNPEGGFRVDLNRRETPLIRINPIYQKLLKSSTISEQERTFLQDKLTNAINFIKSIQQRGETILNIANYIVERQESFFDGDTSSMVPMTLKDIAEKLDRNESTISRAIHNKYMDTPQGIFALKFFFSQAVNEDNKNVSSYNIKEEIKRLVDEENASCPLTDRNIQEHFQAQGIKLARRTINKYRQELNIPPSNLRKE
jgi:RNA polymerase sigma-54 factor